MLSPQIIIYTLKTYLIDLILATSHKKDGKSMCKAFGTMVDEAEKVYEVQVVAVTIRPFSFPFHFLNTRFIKMRSKLRIDSCLIYDRLTHVPDTCLHTER